MQFKDLGKHMIPPEEVVAAAKLLGDHFRKLGVEEWKLLHVQNRVDTDSAKVESIEENKQ